MQTGTRDPAMAPTHRFALTECARLELELLFAEASQFPVTHFAPDPATELGELPAVAVLDDGDPVFKWGSAHRCPAAAFRQRARTEKRP